MKLIISFFAAAVRRVPLVLIIGAVVLTGVFGSLSRDVEIAQGNEGFAPDTAEIKAAERIGELFGSDTQESVLQVVVRSEGGDVITADTLRAVMAVEQAILSSDAAASLSQQEGRPPLASYLAPVEQAVAMQGIDPATLTDAAVKQIYGEALAQTPPEQAGFITQLLSANGDATNATSPAGLILVFLQAPEGDTADEAFNNMIETEVAVADAVRSVEAPAGVELRPFSFSLLFEDQGDFTSEVGRLFGFAALIILLILAFVYWIHPHGNATWGKSIRRTAADVGLTLATIFMAISWMNGIGVILKNVGVIDAFSATTQIIPVLLIGLGVDYGIHLTARYREEAGTASGVEPAIRTAIGTVGVALALATVTTVIGFLTNVFNPIPALKDFGILAAVGIASSFLLMLTFVPAFRFMLDRRAERRGSLPLDAFEGSSSRVLPRIIERASVLAERVPVMTLVVALALGGLGIWGLSNLETRFSFTDFLPEDAPTVQTLDIITEEFGGGFGENSQVLIEAPEGGDLATPEVHNALVASWRNLGTTEDVVTFDLPTGPVASTTSPIALLGQLLQPTPDGTPSDLASQFGQMGLLPDLTVGPDADVAGIWGMAGQVLGAPWAGVVHTDGDAVTAAMFDVQTQAGESGGGKLREDLLAAFQPVADMEESVIPTSQNIISAVIVQSLTDSQTLSLLATIAVATLVLMINFWFENRRPFLGVLTMLPVALVVFWTYGLMFATGIPFGPVTATLAALAVGIGVPFTIHIARRFEEDRVRCDTLEEALRSTTRHTGGALAGSAFTTMAGFGILITSTLVPFQQMGQVTVYAIGLSLVGAVLVLPSLLALWERYHIRRGHEAVARETVAVV